jgi:hypothetical protein
VKPKVCVNEDCEDLFEPKVHNAIYCSEECRRVVTNKKVLSKYYEKKATKNNKNRVCKTEGCDTILSRYNIDDDVCGPCGVVRLKDRLEGWGWDRQKLDEEWAY